MLEAGGARAASVEIIPNGVSRELLSLSAGPDAKKAFGLDGKIVLGFTGFVKDWHGLDRVLDWVAERAPSNMHLVVVGDGPALPALKAQAERLKITDKVTFAGLVARNRIASYVAAFDIALQPKCVEYCSPLKLPEYMALGKAIVAPDQPNIREVLVDGQSALLFEADRPQRLFDALDRLVADAGLRQRLGAAARQTIEQRKLTWQGNAQRVASLARSTTTRSPRVAVGSAGL
jgi:glycosyltransferase involved in cell wall biosynthesis